MQSKESRLEKLMEEAIILLRIFTKPEIASRLNSALNTDELKLAFHHSDGKTTKDIEELTGIKKDRMTNLWKQWTSLGFGEMISVKGGNRFVRSISLEDFGISIPKS
jgi:hypothetical protein